MSKAASVQTDLPNKRALVRVLGCKVNQAEAAAMGRILQEKGYMLNSDEGEPALIVVNTCCVTAAAEAKSRRMVSRLSEKFPSATLVITGCLAEVKPESLSDASTNRHVLGTVQKDRFPEFLERLSGKSEESPPPSLSTLPLFGNLGAAKTPGRARAFLKIHDGCSQRCSYCIVSQARGPSRSLPPETATEYAREMQASGIAEIVLTGVHLGAYGRDLRPPLRLEDFLDALLLECRETRFRLSSVEPQEISERLIALVSGHPGVCRHFHIPVQSGDDAILRHMARPYTAGLTRDLVQRIFHRSRETCVGMDVMVGFPGEDEQAFRNTVSLIEDLRPAYLHVFPFSPRPGTAAASYYPRLPQNVVRRRVEELRRLSTVLRRAFYERFIGQDLTVVPEEPPDRTKKTFKARSDNYIPVTVRYRGNVCERKALVVRMEAIVADEPWGSLSD